MLAMVDACFTADCKHNNRKDKCSFFFGFWVIQRNARNGKTLHYQILIPPQKEMTYAIAIVNKKLVNRTVSFENELVPLNGRITERM